VSTHLYHNLRLSRDHLVEIAAHGFETVEIFATRTHFDYHNPAAVADLQQWLAEAGLELHGIHAPIGERYVAGRWERPLTIASVDPDARAHAMAETERALYIARRIPVKVLVTHLGLPRSQQSSPAENSRDAARRSIEKLQRLAAPLGVRVAVEVIPNELSRTGSLVHFIEEDLDVDDLEVPEAGICLDFGHAHMDGDLLDAIETVSGHLIDPRARQPRRAGDHLVPFQGTIDWPGALTAVRKSNTTVLCCSRSTATVGRDTLRGPKSTARMEQLLAD
jgi:sugar phosphate isomerase/epimerase